MVINDDDSWPDRCATTGAECGADRMIERHALSLADPVQPMTMMVLRMFNGSGSGNVRGQKWIPEA